MLGSDRLYREAGYTALSRATTHTQLYHVAPPPPRYRPAASIDPDAELTRLLSRSAAQQLATTPPLDPIAIRDAALADPGPHLVERIGAPPPAGRGRDAWAAAATAIDTYRRRYHISGPEALGPRPGPSAQARDWDHAAALTAALEHRLGLDHDPGLRL